MNHDRVKITIDATSKTQNEARGFSP